MAGCLYFYNDVDAATHSGAQAAKDALLRIQDVVATGLRERGDFCVEGIADLLEQALDGSAESRRGALLAISDYIGSAIEGCAPELPAWNPLERIAS